MEKVLLGTAAGIVIGIAWSWLGVAHGADMSKPKPAVVAPPPAPAFVGTDPFYIGAFAGYSLSSTSNPVFNDVPDGTNGTTAGTLAGLVAGYGTKLGSLYVGAEVSVAYDFNSGCFGDQCAAERHRGWLFQEVGEFGYGFGNILLAARGGLAERTNNLCAFDPVLVQRDCGSGFAVGPDAGVKVKYAFDPHIDVFAAYDHVWWNNYSASTPTYFDRNGNLEFANSLTIRNEDIFKLGMAFH